MINWDDLDEYLPEGDPVTGDEGIDWDWEALYDDTQSLIGKRKKRRPL